MTRLKTNHPFDLGLGGSLLLSAALVSATQAADLANTSGAATAAPATNRLNLEDAESGSTNQVTNAIASEETQSGGARISHRHSGGNREEVVFGHDVEVKRGETVDNVVVIGGSAKVRGKVREDVVVINGRLDVEGEIDGDAVAVFGGVQVRTNASIHGDAVAVLGSLEVQSNATVKGDGVAFCGDVQVADGGKIQGDSVPILLPFKFGLGKLGVPKWLSSWLNHCVFKLRPLAPQVGWVWVVAGGFFLLYLLIAALFPRPVQVCVEEMTRRPATTFLLGLMTKLLAPFVFFILLITGIGVFVLPFLWAPLFLGGLVGKTVLLEALGVRLGRAFGVGAMQRPLAALVVGTALITLLYLVPVLGLLTYLFIGVWGLGAVVGAAFGGLRRELPPKSTPPSPPTATPAMAFAVTTPGAGAQPADPGPSPLAPMGTGGGNPVPNAPAAALGQAPASPLPPLSAVNLPELLAHPKAGFWERMGAGFLDVVLVSIVSAFTGGHLWLLLALAYFAGLLTWKGTTVGGVLLGLKVVRLDGQPVTFAVALVRSLAAAFSVVVLFLGFLWIAWDPDKQGWHDKIAGTAVLRLPRGTPLVCL